MLDILNNDQKDYMVRRGIAEGLGTIIAVCSKKQIDDAMRAIELRSTERSQRDTPNTLSREGSSSQRASESRSPERVRSGEGSAQGEHLFDQMKKVIDEYPQMKEREKKLKQEVQELQQERNRTQEQLAKMQQDFNRTQEQLTKTQEEHDRFQRQLTDAREERDQARGQLREVEQERNRTRQQLTNAQRERDQAQRERTSAQEQLSQVRIQEEQRKQTWDRLYETMMNAPGQLGRQDERGQSSRGDLGANDALPTTVEGMEEHLERERRGQQESQERAQRLRERIQRTIWEQGDGPQNERLNQLLKYPMDGILEDQHLVEEIYPPDDQPAQDRPALRQSLNKALRHRLRSLYLTLIAEYTPSGLSANDIAGEFVDQLQEQMQAHNRPNQEYIDTVEDVQEEVTGRRPNRTRR